MFQLSSPMSGHCVPGIVGHVNQHTRIVSVNVHRKLPGSQRPRAIEPTCLPYAGLVSFVSDVGIQSLSRVGSTQWTRACSSAFGVSSSKGACISDVSTRPSSFAQPGSTPLDILCSQRPRQHCHLSRSIISSVTLQTVYWPTEGNCD